MAKHFRCPNPACGKTVAISDDLVGRKVRCPHCQGGFATAREADSPPSADNDGLAEEPASPTGATRASRSKQTDRFVAVVTIPSPSNLPLLVLGIGFLALSPILFLIRDAQALTLPWLVFLILGIFELVTFFVQLRNRPVLILDRKAIKLRLPGAAESRVPYANIALVEVGEIVGDE